MSLPSTNEATTTKSANNIVNLKVRDDQRRFLQIVNVGVNKMTSAQAMLENYNSGVSCLKDYHLILKDLNADNKKAVLLQPITVQLNNHNINNEIKALFKVT